MISTGKIELSVAVASKSTTGSIYSIFFGHVSAGASVSGYSVTPKVHDKFNPLIWLATTVTVAWPRAKVEPDAGVETTVRVGDAETVKLTTGLTVVMSSGHMSTG